MCRPSSTGARVTRNQPGATRKHRATVQTDRTHTVGNFRTELMACVGLDRHGASARARSSFFRGLAALTMMDKVGVGRVRDPYELARATDVRSRYLCAVLKKAAQARAGARAFTRTRSADAKCGVRVEPGTRAKRCDAGGYPRFGGGFPPGRNTSFMGLLMRCCPRVIQRQRNTLLDLRVWGQVSLTHLPSFTRRHEQAYL